MEVEKPKEEKKEIMKEKKIVKKKVPPTGPPPEGIINGKSSIGNNEIPVEDTKENQKEDSGDVKVVKKHHKKAPPPLPAGPPPEIEVKKKEEEEEKNEVKKEERITEDSEMPKKVKKPKSKKKIEENKDKENSEVKEGNETLTNEETEPIKKTKKVKTKEELQEATRKAIRKRMKETQMKSQEEAVLKSKDEVLPIQLQKPKTEVSITHIAEVKAPMHKEPKEIKEEKGSQRDVERKESKEHENTKEKQHENETIKKDKDTTKINSSNISEQYLRKKEDDVKIEDMEDILEKETTKKMEKNNLDSANIRDEKDEAMYFEFSQFAIPPKNHTLQRDEEDTKDNELYKRDEHAARQEVLSEPKNTPSTLKVTEGQKSFRQEKSQESKHGESKESFRRTDHEEENKREALTRHSTAQNVGSSPKGSPSGSPSGSGKPSSRHESNDVKRSSTLIKQRNFDYFDPRSVPASSNEILQFLRAPLFSRRGSIIKCFIERNSSGTNKIAPVFTLLLEVNSSSGRPILFAKKRPSNTPHYVFSLDKDDLIRPRQIRGEQYLGKLRGHKRDNDYVLYDDGESPDETEDQQLDLDYTPKDLRQELLAVRYVEPKKNTSTRRIEVAIPAIDERTNTPYSWQPKSSKDTSRSLVFKLNEITELGEQNVRDRDKAIFFHKRETKYDPLSSCIVDFRSRATCVSIKNLQLIHSQPTNQSAMKQYIKLNPSYYYVDEGTVSVPQEHVILQMGKVGKDCFNLDFQYPFSPLQAFALCLTRFDTSIK